MKCIGTVLISVASVFCGAVQAEQISIVNASFEDQQLPQGSWTYPVYGPITGWTGSDAWSAGVWRPNADLLTPTDGAQVAFSNGNYGGALSQTLATELKANTLYTLQVDLINRTDTSTNKSSTVELLAGDHRLASSTIIGGSRGSWQVQTVSFQTGASNTYLGQLLGISLVGGDLQSDWDNVRLTATQIAAVPEPETYALLMAGLGLVGAAVKRRKATQA